MVGLRGEIGDIKSDSLRLKNNHIRLMKNIAYRNSTVLLDG